MEENVGKLVLCEACVPSTGSTKLHLKASLTKAWENAKGMQPNSQSTWDPSFGLVDDGETIANMLKGLKNVKELSNKKMEIRTTTSKINAPSESLVKSKGRWLARRSHLNSKFAAIASTDSKSQDDAIAEASYGEATSILKDPKDPFKNIPVQSSRFKETSIQLGTIKKSLSKEKMKAIKQNVSNGKQKQKRKAINETVVMFDDPNCNVEALTEAPVGQSSYDGEATEAIPELLWNFMYIWLGFEHITA